MVSRELLGFKHYGVDTLSTQHGRRVGARGPATNNENRAGIRDRHIIYIPFRFGNGRVRPGSGTVRRLQSAYVCALLVHSLQFSQVVAVIHRYSGRVIESSVA